MNLDDIWVEFFLSLNCTPALQSLLVNALWGKLTQYLFSELPFLKHLCKLSLGNSWWKYTWASTHKGSALLPQLSCFSSFCNTCQMQVESSFTGGGRDVEVADCHQMYRTLIRGARTGLSGYANPASVWCGKGFANGNLYPQASVFFWGFLTLPKLPSW